MTDNTTLTINPSKPSEFEFDVNIQGVDDLEFPVVRFVIANVRDEYDMLFKCNKVQGEKHKWLAKLPKLDHLKINSTRFRVEVIIDGYYFEPAQGELTLVVSPDVKLTDDKKVDVTVTATVAEMEITGQYAPTNGLLQSEEEPANENIHGNVSVNDEFTDDSRLADDTTDDADEELPAFDPKKVAETIVRTKMGKVEKPTNAGKLFKRSQAGKPVIEGLEDADTLSEKRRKSAAVRDILKTK